MVALAVLRWQAGVGLADATFTVLCKGKVMNNLKMKPIAAAIGTAFAVSLTAGAVGDEANPFEAQLIEDGTLLAEGRKEGDGESNDADASKEGAEANCGDGQCGGSMSADSDEAEDEEVAGEEVAGEEVAGEEANEDEETSAGT